MGDHERRRASPTSIPTILTQLIGSQVRVTTQGGETWSGQVGAVVGTVLVLGQNIRFVDLNTITGVDLGQAEASNDGNVASRRGRVIT